MNGTMPLPYYLATMHFKNMLLLRCCFLFNSHFVATIRVYERKYAIDNVFLFKLHFITQKQSFTTLLFVLLHILLLKHTFLKENVSLLTFFLSELKNMLSATGFFSSHFVTKLFNNVLSFRNRQCVTTL